MRAVHGRKYKITFICPVCGKEEQRTPEETRGRKTCSDKCGHELLRKSEEVILPCRVCGSEVTRPKDQMSEKGPLCDRDCYDSWRSDNLNGENNPNYGSVVVECAYCGESKSLPPSYVNEDGNNFCNRICKGNWRSERPPQEHYNWSGGKSVYVAARRDLGGRSWTKARRKARNKSDHCRLCGSETNPSSDHLDTHHIIPIMAGGCNAEPLMMSLCRPCHQTVESYTKTFTEPVLVD